MFKTRYVLDGSLLFDLSSPAFFSFTLVFKVPVYFLVLSAALNKTCRVPFPPIPDPKHKYYAGSVVTLVAKAFSFAPNV